MSDPLALGAYVFAGGHAVGVAPYFDVVAHLEGDGGYGAATFSRNFPEVPVYHGPRNWPLDELAELNLAWIYSNPPCAIVSVAGRSLRLGRDSWRTDPRTHCLTTCLELGLSLRPAAFSTESVTQLYSRARELVDGYALRYQAAGYEVNHLFIDARWHGVPQKRRRYFFVASRFSLDFPPLNYGPPPTVAEALGEVTDPGWRYDRDPYAHLYEEMKPGESLRSAWERRNPDNVWEYNARGQVRGRPKMMDYRLPVDQPMGAFIGDFFVHPTEPRRLGIEEAKALCRFPDWFDLAPDRGEAFSLMARGVMPPVAEYLARAIRAGWEADRPSREFINVVDLRKEPPTQLDLPQPRALV